MLFTDGVFVTQSDLTKLESEIPDIASAQGITVADVIEDTHQELAELILSKVQRFMGRNTFNVAQDIGVQESAQRPRVSLTQVVVDDADNPLIWTSLKRLAVNMTLYNFYRNASRRTGEDRYQEAMELYRDEIDHKYIHRFLKAGLPTVSKPLPRPGSTYEPGSGAWGNANLTAIVGGTVTPGANYDVVITWVDGSQTLNGESAPSERATVTVASLDNIRVSIAGLAAPNGTYRQSAVARVAVTTLNTTGWNVYAGVRSQTLYKQNATVIPYGTKTYDIILPVATVTQVGTGQYAEVYQTMQTVVSRG